MGSPTPLDPQRELLRHHPLVRTYPDASGECPPDFEVDFLGVRTRRSFAADLRNARDASLTTASFPRFDNEYFEWIDILESVEEAQNTFVMIDVGAGYGRWCVRAALAARRKGHLDFRCVAIEPEPDHFRWLRQHFADNELNPREHELIWAVAGAQPGFVPFWVGTPSGWYGQAIAKRPATPLPDVRTRQRLRARSVLGLPPVVSATEATVTWVPSIVLSEAIAAHGRIDFMDLDIQGAELEVLTAAINLVTERVRRIHIGTHSALVEDGLRELFRSEGWQNLNDYAGQSRTTTPYGEMEFEDGVQTWLNPALAPGSSPSARRRVPATDRTALTRLQRQIAQMARRMRDLKEKNARLRERCRSLEMKLRTLRESRAASTTWPSWLAFFGKRRNL